MFPGFLQLPLRNCCDFYVVKTEPRQQSGDKLADIHQYAMDLQVSDDPGEVAVGQNLMLILRGKRLPARTPCGTP